MAVGWVKPTSALVQRARRAGFFKFGWNNSGPRRYASRFGSVENRVQLKADGTPDFDRMVYFEAPNINAVVWGVDSEGQLCIGVTIQARPFSDNPDGNPADPAIIF